MNASSRYSRGEVVTVDHPIEGRVQVVHLSPLRWNNYPYTKYQATSADSLTSLAYKAYGDAGAYWFIASMNPLVDHPSDLAAGTILQVPTGKNW